MNTIQDTATTSPELLNPLEETIRIPVQDGFNPVLIDLDQVFGAKGLSFKVAVESYGQVEAYIFQSRELLCLTLGELAEPGQKVQVALRATDAEGEFVVYSFTVRLVPAEMEALSAA